MTPSFFVFLFQMQKNLIISGQALSLGSATAGCRPCPGTFIAPRERLSLWTQQPGPVLRNLRWGPVKSNVDLGGLNYVQDCTLDFSGRCCSRPKLPFRCMSNSLLYSVSLILLSYFKSPHFSDMISFRDTDAPLSSE